MAKGVVKRNRKESFKTHEFETDIKKMKLEDVNQPSHDANSIHGDHNFFDLCKQTAVNDDNNFITNNKFLVKGLNSVISP